MSKWYNIAVTDVTVHRWSNEEGQGDYVCSKGGFTIGNEPTIEKARQRINEFFGYEIDEDCIDGDRIMAHQIENGDAYKDDDGGYIADYDIKIHCVETVTFNEGI